jgi:hypothetical protein
LEAMYFVSVCFNCDLNSSPQRTLLFARYDLRTGEPNSKAAVKAGCCYNHLLTQRQ